MAVLKISDLEVKPAPRSGIYKIKFNTIFGMVEGIFKVKAARGYKYVASEIKIEEKGELRTYTPQKYRSILSGKWLKVKE